MTKETTEAIKAGAIVVLGIVVGGLIYQYAGAMGRISVLMENADSLGVATANALEAEAIARLAEAEAKMQLAQAFEEAAQERADAAVRQAEARATLIVQEAEGEAAFRRLHDYLGANDDLVGQRLAEEMDAEFRVQGMLADEALEVAAADLLTAHNTIVNLESLSLQKDATHAATLEAHELTNAANRAENAIKDQIIEEQQNALAPSFFPNLFKNAKLVIGSAVVGGAITYVLTKDDQ